jgi:hypothetical protein
MGTSTRFSMKTIIAILILSFSLSVIAQDYNPYKKEWRYKEAVKTIALFSSSIILDAVGDGLNDNGQKVWGHALQATSTGLLVASPFILDVDKSQWGWYAASYISLRIGLFDPAYNLTRGLPVDYVGNSSLWDKTIREAKSPGGLLMMGRSIFFTVGIFIPINEL